jgi:hypothetical protein
VAWLVPALLLGWATPVARAQESPRLTLFPAPADPPHEAPLRPNNPYRFLETPAPPHDDSPNGGTAEKHLLGTSWVQVMGGFIHSPISGLGPNRLPTFDVAPINVRLGLILTEPRHEGLLRGVVEGIFEVSAKPVVQGSGNIVVGPGFLLRYSFVQPECRLIPYLQVGAGIAYNDAYQDLSQTAIGQALEFTLQAGVGMRCLLNQSWSLDAEADYLHISNAHMAKRNAGINGVGGTIGFTYYFHTRHR